MRDIFNLFKQSDTVEDFDFIRVSIAAPEKIRSWSYGEVKKPENHQLSHLQAGARWVVLRQTVWPGERLRMSVR